MQIENIGCGGHNAYLIKDVKCAVIDTVPAKYKDEYIANIEKHTDRVDYLICTHTSPDLSGTLAAFIKRWQDAEIIASTAGIRNLKVMLDMPFNESIAKDGGELSLVEDSLKFIITPNLNWPDTMMAATKNSLFSGLMFAGGEEYFEETFSSYRPFVNSALEKIGAPAFIYPAKGEVRGADIVESYRAWSKPKDTDTVLVLYDSIYGATLDMARLICSVLEENKIAARLCFAQDADDTLINACRALIVGTPTVNRGASKKVMSALSGLDAVRCTRKPGFVFGAYGWGGEGTYIVYNLLKNLRMNMYEKPFLVNFRLGIREREKLKKHTLDFIESCLRDKD
ncbi:MAG: flavodoxin domain-containing protein [Clostridiales bacterium]|nr:flavodoxin domain-containing protein [Clostridiales bacterium]